MVCKCKHCGALLWYDERSEKSKKPLKPNFSICCMKGIVRIPNLDDPPKLLANLLNGEDPMSNHFLDNIRTYNSMFAFTSIGGKVKTDINDGGGPPQFVI